MAANENETNPNGEQNRKRLRKTALMSLAAIFAAAGLAYGAYWGLFGSNRQTTDDAYVAGNRVPVMAEAEGTVVAVLADETSEVQQGQVLVRLDDSDARVNLQEAEARLASTVRHVQELYATDKQLTAKAEAQQATLAQARSDYQRHQQLNRRGYYSDSALEHSSTQVQIEEHALAEAEHAQSAVHAEVANTDVADHPDVKLAAAEVRAAYLALQRTTVVAPVSGYVAKRDVQIGERVATNTPLMAIVPLSQIWVNANFKESQLDRIRPGQAVSLHSDVYGNGVVFHGIVAGLDAGTGSAFSLLPPQNATGNWIKVVQRVPVRVLIDQDDLRQHPLRLGLSMEVTVDTHVASAGVALDPPPAPAYATPVYDQRLEGVEPLIADIIRSNSVSAAAPHLAAVVTGTALLASHDR